MKPFSSTNSARWKPGGRSSPIVCRITRAPANPTSASGSARITSPSEAYEASTPAVEGSVRIETNGSRSSWSRASSAEVLAICMSERMPSCMRAPPVAETMISARRSAIARSIERATFSPTTEPMLPPMKKKSMTVRLTGLPPIGRDARERRVLHAGVALRGLETVGIAHLGVAELERIAGFEIGVALLERVGVDQVAEIGARRNAEVVVAVRAGPEVLLEHGLEQGLAAALALGPQTLGDIGRGSFLSRLDAGAFAFEPGHRGFR